MQVSERPKDDLRHDERALAEVIGFILIICVIVIFMVIWVTYHVPAHGRDAEIKHMNYVKDWFTDYKIALDSLWNNNDMANPEQDPLSGVIISSSLNLGTMGGSSESPGLFFSIMKPIASSGTLRINNSHEWLILTPSGSPARNFSLPALEYTAENNYWIPQTYYYQMGGVFLRQSTGSIIRIRPAISMEDTTVTLVPINIVPATGTREFTGSSSVRIDTRLMTKSGYTLSSGSYSSVNLTFLLRDPPTARAWKISLEEMCAGQSGCHCDIYSTGSEVRLNVTPLSSPNINLEVYPANYTVGIQPIGVWGA